MLIKKRIIEEVDVCKGLVEKERMAVFNRSKALFTLSAICMAANELLAGLDLSIQEKIDLAERYCSKAGMYIPNGKKLKLAI